MKSRKVGKQTNMFWRSLVILLVFSAIVFSCQSGSNWGSEYLCEDCEQSAFTCDIGTCAVCGRGTSSGAFELCNHCADKLGKCQACQKDLFE